VTTNPLRQLAAQTFEHAIDNESTSQLLCDHPEGLSKKSGHLDQLVDFPCYRRWNHAPVMVSLSLAPHAKLDAKTPCTHTDEKLVWDHAHDALRGSGDRGDTDTGTSKLWRGLVKVTGLPGMRLVSKVAPSSHEHFSRTTPSTENANECAWLPCVGASALILRLSSRKKSGNLRVTGDSIFNAS
jgi:hypothetical protein